MNGLPDANGASSTSGVKRDLRPGYRALRRSLPNQAARSVQIWLRVTGLPEVRTARSILMYESVVGEPGSAPFIAWCEESGKRVVVVEGSPSADHPSDPSEFDVVIVPGLAFTADGRRLGQGGGWYDRLLLRVRDDCVTVGVCFASLLVGDLPTEPHDVQLDRVVTEHEVYGAGPRTARPRSGQPSS